MTTENRMDEIQKLVCEIEQEQPDMLAFGPLDCGITIHCEIKHYEQVGDATNRFAIWLYENGQRAAN